MTDFPIAMEAGKESSVPLVGDFNPAKDPASNSNTSICISITNKKYLQLSAQQISIFGESEVAETNNPI